jgi:hyperosmotically inducible periplasmic protein
MRRVMRPVIRAFLVLLLLVIAGFALFLYLPLSWAGRGTTAQSSPSAVGTTGINGATERARERGAEIGEKAALATAKVHETMADAAITAKIKAKMTLDDSVRARTIYVSTTGSTVTLTGYVRSVAEHDRAVALTRQTDGVTQVVDHLAIER